LAFGMFGVVVCVELPGVVDDGTGQGPGLGVMDGAFLLLGIVVVGFVTEGVVLLDGVVDGVVVGCVAVVDDGMPGSDGAAMAAGAANRPQITNVKISLRMANLPCARFAGLREGNARESGWWHHNRDAPSPAKPTA
jgi:hypothetical protein